MRITFNTNISSKSISQNFKAKRNEHKISSKATCMDSFSCEEKMRPTFVNIQGLVFDRYENSVPSGMYKSSLCYPETQRLKDNISKLYAATEKTGVGKVSEPLLLSRHVSITGRAKEAFRQELLSQAWRDDVQLSKNTFLDNWTKKRINETIHNFETFSSTKNWSMSVDMASDGLLKYTFSKIDDKANTKFSVLGTKEILIQGFESEDYGANSDFDGSGVSRYNQGCALFQKINRKPELIDKLSQGLYSFNQIVPVKIR